MKNKLILISALIITSLALSGCDAQGERASTAPQPSPTASAEGLMSKMVQQKADKIEVVHFHATQQCYSCITVGKYALKTIQERFPKEYENGMIVFRDINAELPENRDTVIQYQARGSSLFVNGITGGQDHIQEDVRVWRLVNDEQAFMDYFEGKLKELLG
jgi:hypothetical protein